MMSWSSRPLHRLIFSILERKKSMMYDALVKEVRNHTKDVSENEIRNALMRLEIWGKIDVISINEKHLKVILRES